MKKSELNKFIREQIINVLSEQKPISEDEEIKEPTKQQLKRGSGSLTRLGYQLADVQAEMRTLARKYSKAEGEEKEELLKKLKEKTQIKKELEKAINK